MSQADACSPGGCGRAADRPDQRLGPHQRMQLSRHFEQAFASGAGLPGRCMVLWVRRTDDAAQRVGVIASRRTFRRAVDRNRAKRRLREAFRRNRWRLIPSVDVVLVARRRILDASVGDVERDLLKLAARAEILEMKENA